MLEATTTTIDFPPTSQDVLTEILREGAQRLLTTAVEAEVAQYVDTHQHRPGKGVCPGKGVRNRFAIRRQG